MTGRAGWNERRNDVGISIVLTLFRFVYDRNDDVDR